jgi:DNA-binding SARP family transcriptional activator
MGDADAKAPLLTQPRRLAVLAYLVLARPRALHSRDTIVSLLWPEADQASGRHALRNALHGIRHALGDVIVNAGDEQVGVNRDRISCDAIDLEADIAAGRLSEGLARYSGELLQGFHVADAPQFEHWLDGERSRLHDLAFRAAVSVSDASRARGDADGALSAARRASALAPDDETSLRRLMEILSAAGDKRGALREYERFAVRAIEEYGAEPGAETLKLARSLRATASKPQASPSAKKVVVSASDSPLSDPNASAINTKVVDAMPPVDTTVARGRRLVVGGITTLAVVVLLAIGWRGGPLAQATTARSLGAARGIASIGAVARLPERYRADTALLRRYLVAEADLQFSRLAPARESFQRLVDENPLYAPAWAGLGFALFSSGFEEMAPSDAMPRAVAAANHALAMDSTLVEAQSTLIANAMFWRWDLPEAKRRIDAALAMHPNDPELQNLLATWYRWRGDVEAAVRLKARTLAIDPLSPRYTKQVGSSLYFAHRCKEAAEIFRRIAEERRRNSYVGLTLYRSLKCLGKMDEATVAMRQYLVETGDTTLAHLLDPPLPPARRDSAISTVFRAKLDRRFEQRRRTWKTSTEAMLDYAEMQNRDSTLAWLDSMYVERAFMLHVVPFDPTMDFLRGDPRFEEFLRRLPWKPEAVILADPTSRR